jgi:hypothetical protein
MVAKVGKQTPRTEHVDANDVPDEFVGRFVEQQLAEQRELEDEMGSTKMLGSLIIAIAVVCLCVLAGSSIAAYLP